MRVIKILVFLLFLLFPFGQLERLPLNLPGVGIYLHDLVLVLIWVWLLLNYRGWLLKSKLPKRLLTFSLICLLSWLLNLPRWGSQSFLGLAYLIRWLLLSGVYFAVKVLIESDSNIKESVSRLVRSAVFWTAIFGWIQYLFWPDLIYLKYFGWDDHYYRLTGSFLDPNFMGMVLVLGLGLEFTMKGSFLKKLFLLITLAFTYSRASWLAWLVLLFGWGMRRVFWLKEAKTIFLRLRQILSSGIELGGLFLYLAISIIVFFLLPRPTGEGGNLLRTASAYDRLQSWQNSLVIIKENPIFGVGFNNYRLAQKKLSSLFSSVGEWKENHAGAGVDNSFLFVWATTGGIGLIAFLILVSGLRPIWLIVPLLVHSFFNNSLFYPWVLILLWAASGLVGEGDLK